MSVSPSDRISQPRAPVLRLVVVKVKCDIARSLPLHARQSPLLLSDVEPNLFARNLDLGQGGVEIEAAANDDNGV